MILTYIKADVPGSHGMMDTLVTFVTSSAALVFKPDAQLSRAKAALAAWARIASREPVLETAVHLFEAAIRYKETSDERVLLELPDEERSILRGIIDAAKETESAAHKGAPPDRD